MPKLQITVTVELKNLIEILQEEGETFSACAARLLRYGAQQTVLDKIEIEKYLESQKK